MKKTLLCLTLAGLLSACGGSDNDSDSNPNPPPSSTTQIGVLTDGPVTGVKYLRTSSSGESIEDFTNDKGEFKYAEGDTVRFFIGDVQLGEAIEAKARITPLDLAESENALGVDFDASHIAELWDLRYLPLEIKALPEGSIVPCKVPVLTVKNTNPKFFWLTNYFETAMSAELWKFINNATIAFQYRAILEYWADKTGSPKDFVLWQGHDFSMRGMSGVCDSALNGVSHLMLFLGTDTIPAINSAELYYNAIDSFVGGSVPASEHSCMCAGGQDGEVETFRRLLKKYPTGVVSIVSDTWDFWNIVTNTAKELKDEIMNRQPNAVGLAKTVFRPDCYAEGTQILTPNGWVDFKEVTENTLVAQVHNDGTFDFVYPEKVVAQHYSGKMVKFSDKKGKVDFTVTPNHRMISAIGGSIRVDLAEDLKVGYHHRSFYRTAEAKSIGEPLSDIERLKIAFQADGSFCTDSKSKIRFSFNKQRKIDRLLDILKRLGKEYSIYDLKDQKKEIHIVANSSEFLKDFSWVDITKLTKNWSQEFIEELSYWDSCRRTSSRFKFDSTTKSVIDVVELVAVAAGYGVLVSEYEDNRKTHFSKMYTCNILKSNIIGGQAISKSFVDYSGMVYCVKVPSGMVLVKNNRATLVCGNSGDPVEILCGVEIPNAESLEEAEEILKDLTDWEEGECFGPDTAKGLFRIDGEVFEVVVEPEWNRHDKRFYYIDGWYPTKSKKVELTPAQKGAVECLWEIFGGTVTDKGYKLLDSHVGLIYGDSITLERAEKIMERLAAKGFASANVVLGIGSYTYQYSTRDCFGQAMKATYAVVNGEGRELFKDPVTDSGTKKSAKGLLKVSLDSEGKYFLEDQVTPEQEAEGCLRTVYKDGNLLVDESLDEIRQRLNAEVQKQVQKMKSKA